MGPSLSRKACMNCRQRHLKCDMQLPSCDRCRKSKLACNDRSRHEFRIINFDEAGELSSLEAEEPPLLSLIRGNKASVNDNFVDETGRIVEAYSQQRNLERGDSEYELAIPTNTPQPQPLANETDTSTVWKAFDAFSQSQDLSPSTAAALNNPPSIIGLPLAATIQHVTSNNEKAADRTGRWTERAAAAVGESLDPLAGSDPPTQHDHVPANAHTQLADDGDFQVSTTPSIGVVCLDWSSSVQRSAVTISPGEAELVKVFTQTWAPIFDCLDADRTFTRTVARLALTTSQPLLWAVLATSALQLSRVSEYPFAAAQYYRSKCSKAIMPILLTSTHPEESEEILFATYVLLRNYEHMTEKFTEKSTESLFTAALAISVNPSEQISHQADVGRAAFWVHLRQDIHIALLLRVPISTDYPPCVQKDKILLALDRITTQQVAVSQEALDCAWANSLASLVVEVINYCFQDVSRDIQTWISLRSRLDHWNLTKPASFRPYCERDRSLSEGRTFPEFWLWSDCHVIAWLYFHSAIILLRMYPPGSENMGLTHSMTGDLANRQEILLHARAIFGIVTTNPNAQALIMMCHLATISAVFFTDKTEKADTIKLLRMARTVTGHPCEDIEKMLYTHWKM